MTLLAARVTLSLVSMSGIAATAWLLMHPLPDASRAGPGRKLQGTRPEPSTVAAKAESAATAIVQAAPFRVSRAATTVTYDPARIQASSGAQVAAVPKPVLVLSGIAWGTPPSAVIEGVPGAARARVMQRGDTGGGLRMRRVERTRVIVTGYDTTWTLEVRGLP